MENSSGKHPNCLKDVSNISRNKLVSAFPNNQMSAVKNLAFSVHTNTMKISGSNPIVANQELDKENFDPRFVVPLPGCKQVNPSEISSIKMETSSKSYGVDSANSDSSCDGFEINEDLELDEADKTQELLGSPNTASGGSIAKEAPSPDLHSLLHSRVFFNVPDPIIKESLENNGASPMFPIAPNPRQERRKLDFSNLDTTSPVSTSSENQQRKRSFGRSVSMVERGQRLLLNKTSPELSRQVGSDLDMTSPTSRPFVSFKRPNVPLQPLSQNNLQEGSNPAPYDGIVPQPCKKIRRGLSMKDFGRNSDENPFLYKTSNLSNLMDSPQIAKPMLQLSLSESQANIERALSLTDVPNLTGDKSRCLSLPTVQGNGKNAKNLDHLDCHTLADLLQGKYDDKIASYRIIDARYCYEFKGGHIRGAENFGAWDEEAFFNEFLPKEKGSANCPGSEDKAEIIIFHCEFSSERGPRLMSNLRNKDRSMNKDTYPALHYPECYLLSQGYKEFYQNYPHLCEPRAYVKMLDPSYASEERKFHKKSKTWGGQGGTISRTNSSSRLLKL